MELSMCGYRCDLCKAHPANVRQKDERAELSAMWKKYYDLDIPPEQIVCDGCRCQGAEAQRIDEGCPVRPCVMNKGLHNCSECADWPCTLFHGRVGMNRSVAKAMQGDAYSEAEFTTYLQAFDNCTHLGLKHPGEA